MAVLVSMLVAAPPGHAQQPTTREAGLPVVTSASGSPEEVRTVEALEAVLLRWNPRAFIFTDSVVVAEGSIPRSHPVPILDTEHAADPKALLALFLHEQLHHFDVPNMDYPGAAAALERLYPDPPLTPPEGSLTRSGTYLHLIVCDLELAALSHLLGPGEARRLLARKNVYRWIYRTVLEDPRIREIAERHGLTISPLVHPPEHSGSHPSPATTTR